MREAIVLRMGVLARICSKPDKTAMQLSRESYRVRWIVLVTLWALAGTALCLHTRLVDDYLEIVGHLGLRGAPTFETPLTRAYPAFAADAQMWVRHALALLEGNDLQL